MIKAGSAVYFLLFFLTHGVYAEADIYTITAQQWTMPRQDTVLIEFPPLQQAVAKLKAQPGSRLLIRYPGGDEGSLWLNELQSWLVALGIASKDMELIPGSSRQAVIEMEVVNGNKNRVSGNTVSTEQRNKSLNLSGVK